MDLKRSIQRICRLLGHSSILRKVCTHTASVVGYEGVDNDNAYGAETGEKEDRLHAPFGTGISAS